MKLKQLVIALLGIQFVACAHQPISQDSNLSHKVYRGYENLVGKESYSFDGRTQFQLKSATVATQAPVSSEQAEKEKLEKQKLLSTVISQQKVSNEQLKWMQEGIAKGETQSDEISEDKLANFIQTITGRFFYDYSGIVDLSRGQMTFDSQFGYKARNAEAWIKIPLALDLRTDKAYADLSGFSPLLTDPKHDGRYVVFDYSKLLNDFKVDKKEVLSVLREYMLVNAALAKESDYQKLPATVQDKGLQRIRYSNTYEEITAQYILYFYLNEKYLKNIFSESEKKQAEVVGNLLGGISQPKKFAESLGQTESALGLDQDHTASAARVRLETAFELARQTLDDLNQQEEDEAYEAALAAAEDSAYEAAASAHDDVEEQEEDYSGEQEEGVDAAVSSKTEEAFGEALKTFDQYQSKDKLMTAIEIKKIVAAHPTEYQELIKLTKAPLDEIGLSGEPMVVDMTLDSKDRIVRSEMNINLSAKELFGGEVNLNMAANFHNYGQAKVDQNIFKNAMKFEEISKGNTVLGLLGGSKDDEKLEEGLTSASWSNEKRYEELAKSLMKQNMSFIDAYTVVYRYAYLLEQGIDTDEVFEPEQLLNTARWNAIYFAEEYGLGVTAAQSTEYDNSPDDWMYYDESLSDDIWAIFEDIMDDQIYQDLYQKLRPKYKNDAVLFSAIYKAMDEINEKKRLEVTTVDYPVGFDDFVKVLGELAIEDLKTQTVNQQKIDQLTGRDMAWFEAEIYEQTYQQFLNHK